MKKLTLKDCQTHADRFGGRCQSKNYPGAGQPILWECQNNHLWKARFRDILQGHWCPKCAHNRKRKTIEDCQNLATQNDGLCLSTVYKIASAQYRWKCSKGHIWKARYDDVKKGHWCPRCRHHESTSEAEVRTIIERLTGWKFPNVWPEFLRGINGRKLQLDGYSEEHKIAFEYQGVQHYKPVYGCAKLKRLKRNDNRKRMQCKRHGVYLIRVPYFKSNIEEFIKRKLHRR